MPIQPTPQTKTQLQTLINNYIADGSPNIKKEEHREIETEILNRVDGRILATGTFSHGHNTGFLSFFVTFEDGIQLYTTNYLVHTTPVSPNYTTSNLRPFSHRTSIAISNKTTTGFTAQCRRSYQAGSAVFHYVVVNLANNI